MFKHRIFIFAVLLCFLPLVALAGGPLYVTSDGEAYAWDNSSAIPIHPESGSCGPYSNTDMISRVTSSLSVWTSASGVDLSFQSVTGIVGLADGSNYTDYFYLGTAIAEDLEQSTDNINPILFDDDASMVEDLAGVANKFFVLGLAAPSGYSESTAQIADGQAIINCRCLENHPSESCELLGVDITYAIEEIDWVVVHEMGHFLNLDHSQVNTDFFDTSSTTDDAHIPIMYPYVVENYGTLTARRDDTVALANLYPDEDFETTGCWITGDLLDRNGDELRCADVWAETDNPADTVSAVSGVLAQTDSTTGECEQDCGFFKLFLETGKDYTITVKPIDGDFIGGSGVGPCRSAQITTITEEVIDTIASSQCSAGVLSYLGEYTTQSSGGTGSSTTGGSDSDDDSSGGGGGSGGDGFDQRLNPVGYGCSLYPQGINPVPHSSVASVWFAFLVLVVALRRRSS